MISYTVFFLAQQPFLGLGRLLVELSRIDKIRHTPVELFWTCDQLVADAAIYTTYNNTQETNRHAVSGIRKSDPNNQAAADSRLKLTTESGFP